MIVFIIGWHGTSLADIIFTAVLPKAKYLLTSAVKPTKIKHITLDDEMRRDFKGN